MAVVAGTCVASGLIFVRQLLEYIGGGIVDGNQARMCAVHEMAARCSFLSQDVVCAVCLKAYLLLLQQSQAEFRHTPGTFEEWPSGRK